MCGLEIEEYKLKSCKYDSLSTNIRQSEFMVCSYVLHI